MIVVGEDETRAALPWKALIEAIREGFRAGWAMPVKHQHFVEVPGEADAKLLLMPAWAVGEYIAVKVATVFPGNAARGLPGVTAAMLLLSGRTGASLAVIDGGELTARRTAATSALAADYLARKDSKHLVVVGTGRLAGSSLIEAHAAVRPIERVTIWGRNPAKAAAVAARIGETGLDATATEDLAAAVGAADIVTSATIAQEPVIEGDWLRPGVHVDSVGTYSAESRETDDAVVRRATIFVDTRAGAPHAAGDLAIPLETGVITESDIAADLYDLTRGNHPGRTSAEEVTFFKSVGAAVEDLAAARLVYEERGGGCPHPSTGPG
jgi:ornithine cyclodeaminase